MTFLVPGRLDIQDSNGVASEFQFFPPPFALEGPKPVLGDRRL